MKTLRMCIACRQMKGKEELLRIVKNKSGEIFVDQSGKADGRGTYVCKSEECFCKLKKQKCLNRTFKMPVDEKIYDDILKGINSERKN